MSTSPELYSFPYNTPKLSLYKSKKQEVVASELLNLLCLIVDVSARPTRKKDEKEQFEKTRLY
jgi:hypothetical protein